MNLEQQMQALLKVAEDFRAERCSALLAAAKRESRRLLAEVHAAMRRRVREALAAEREQLACAVAEAQAKLVTRHREHRQKRTVAALKQAWPRLEHALCERWQSPSGRARWVERHLAIAKTVLPPNAWTIIHPLQWPDAEQAQACLQALGIEGASFQADATLRAGIRVVSGPNTLDASLEGLLPDRAAIEGRLLHYLGDAA